MWLNFARDRSLEIDTYTFVDYSSDEDMFQRYDLVCYRKAEGIGMRTLLDAYWDDYSAEVPVTPAEYGLALSMCSRGLMTSAPSY